MRRAGRLAETLMIAIIVPVLLTAVNVRLLATDAYVRWGLARVAAPTAMMPAERDASALAIADFVVGRHDGPIELGLALAGQPLPRRASVGEDWDEQSHIIEILPRVDAEVRHLIDVSRVLSKLWWFTATVVVATAASWGVQLMWAPERRAGIRAYLRRFARCGGFSTMGLVALVGIGIATGWERTFVLFHEILFPQGNWAFPAESLLIQIFPNQFWFESAAALVGLTTVEAAALVWWGRRGNAPTRSKPERLAPAAAGGSP